MMKHADKKARMQLSTPVSEVCNHIFSARSNDAAVDVLPWLFWLFAVFTVKAWLQ